MNARLLVLHGQNNTRVHFAVAPKQRPVHSHGGARACLMLTCLSHRNSSSGNVRCGSRYWQMRAVSSNLAMVTWARCCYQIRENLRDRRTIAACTRFVRRCKEMMAATTFFTFVVIIQQQLHAECHGMNNELRRVNCSLRHQLFSKCRIKCKIYKIFVHLFVLI